MYLFIFSSLSIARSLSLFESSSPSLPPSRTISKYTPITPQQHLYLTIYSRTMTFNMARM